MDKFRQHFLQRGRQYLITVRSSLWFIPGLMIAASIILALALIEVDSRMDIEWFEKFPHLFGLGADGSRGMLTAIASSMLTVAGLCFSLTLSTIAQASAQYTPRILRNFMRDRTNQFILGYFVSIFAYCLVVLRTIRGGDEFKFVPSLGVLTGLVLAIGGILVLIYFIHHIATSLQVTHIIEGIEAETSSVTERIFPDELERENADDVADTGDEVTETITEAIAHWYPVNSAVSGYVQFIDMDALTEFADKRSATMRMEYGVGQFVGYGTALLMSSVKLEDGDEDELNSFFNVYRYRTIEQDVGYGIRQIVDIALKALSPGINDTTTAISCIDYLGVIVGRLATRRLTSPYRTVDGEVRVLVKAPQFGDYAGTAFDQIRISGTGNFAILVRLLKAFALVAERSVTPDRIAVMRHQMELTRQFARQTLTTDYEKEKFDEYYDRELERMVLP